jgi:hypothetical protein
MDNYLQSDTDEENLCQKKRIMATPPLVKYFSQDESSSSSDNEEEGKMLNIGNGNGIGMVEQKTNNGHQNEVSKEQKHPVNF